MNPFLEHRLLVNRRHFFGQAGIGIGALALGSLLDEPASAAPKRRRNRIGGLSDLPHYDPKVKRVIYLCQSGGPSQLDLYDPKPHLLERFGEEVPKSVYPDERKTTMTSGQEGFPTAPSRFKFARHGENGVELSELLPHLAQVVDDVCIIRSMYTEAINHDPAITFFQTGSQIPGRPSMGAWLTYGLGSENADLPAFVAMSSTRHRSKQGNRSTTGCGGADFCRPSIRGSSSETSALRSWTSRIRPGVDAKPAPPEMVNGLSSSSISKSTRTVGDAAIQTRIAQYELAYRMQSFRAGPRRPHARAEVNVRPLRSEEARTTGHAIRLQLSHRPPPRGAGRAVHSALSSGMGPAQQPAGAACAKQTGDTDRATAALITDLKQRGMLEETLIVWGGEFGRTVYCQGELTDNSLRPGPSPQLLHDVAGWRWGEGRASPTERRTITALTSSKTASTSTTCRRRSCT